MMLSVLAAVVIAGVDLPVVSVDRDNFEIRESARVDLARDVIADADGNGVIHIIGDDLVVDFTDAHLRGAAHGLDPDQYSGIGVRITGSNNTIRGGRFSGFKVAIHAVDADGLTIEDVDVSDNFRQRLRSTPEEPSPEDELRPYENDDREWMRNYGAGISVESSENITIRRVRARNAQNGILLSRVNDSRIYDNDCSFLSGWGLALWRSSRNVISRNAFDFCVRGYRHGAYSVSHGSAGILLVEQCSENIVAKNSITHGGRGIHSFGGREAIGQADPRDDAEWHRKRGNVGNTFIDNELSYAGTDAVKMAFVFNATIARNRIARNAIHGVSVAFGIETLITLNNIEENGRAAPDENRGGVHIEHGYANRIQENWFRRNPLAIRLTAPEDHPALSLPWAEINYDGAASNVIVYNDFIQDELVTRAHNTAETFYGRNDHFFVTRFLDGDEFSLGNFRRARDRQRVDRQQWDDLPIHGDSSPIGAREHLHGHEHIVMREWGPYDWSSPGLHLYVREADRHVYRVLGDDPPPEISLVATLCRTRTRDASDSASFVSADLDHQGRTLTVRAVERNRVVPYSVELTTPSGALKTDGVLIPATWSITVFPWYNDPREHVELWRMDSTARGPEPGVGGGHTFTIEAPSLALNYGLGGPNQLDIAPGEVRASLQPVDRFGTFAETRLTFPPGTWRIRTVSADAVRMWLNDEKVIDDWSGHRSGEPREHAHEFTLAAPRDITIRVEHYDLEGYATLKLEIEEVTE